MGVGACGARLGVVLIRTRAAAPRPVRLFVGLASITSFVWNL